MPFEILTRVHRSTCTERFHFHVERGIGGVGEQAAFIRMQGVGVEDVEGSGVDGEAGSVFEPEGAQRGPIGFVPEGNLFGFDACGMVMRRRSRAREQPSRLR